MTDAAEGVPDHNVTDEELLAAGASEEFIRATRQPLPDSIYDRLILARRYMPDWVQKDGMHGAQGNRKAKANDNADPRGRQQQRSQGKYSYLSEEAVKFYTKQAWDKAGLMPTFIGFEILDRRARNTGENKAMTVYDVKCTILFEMGTQCLRYEAFGSGEDYQDKALLKAQTAAFRECIKCIMLIPSGDDPEAFPDAPASNASKPAKQEQRGDQGQGRREQQQVDQGGDKTEALKTLKAARQHHKLPGNMLEGACRKIFGCNVMALSAADLERFANMVGNWSADTAAAVGKGNYKNLQTYERSK